MNRSGSLDPFLRAFEQFAPCDRPPRRADLKAKLLERNVQLGLILPFRSEPSPTCPNKYQDSKPLAGHQGKGATDQCFGGWRSSLIPRIRHIAALCRDRFDAPPDCRPRYSKLWVSALARLLCRKLRGPF